MNKEIQRDAPFEPAHLLEFERERELPMFGDESKPFAKRRSYFERPHPDTAFPLFRRQKPHRNKSLSDQKNFLRLCKKCVSGVPFRPNAEPSWRQFFPAGTTEKRALGAK
jgi:hypothetical protein